MNKILIIDFGSQTCHLIGRRIQTLGLEIKICQPDEALNLLQTHKFFGIIFSGGPASVYEKNSPQISPKIFEQKIPILGICYGMQLTAYVLGGEVKNLGRREFGPANIQIDNHNLLFDSLPDKIRVWMSHGDEVIKLPTGFKSLASSEKIQYAAFFNETSNIFGVQFHPEVAHTDFGTKILENWLEKICKLVLVKRPLVPPEEIIKSIKKKVGNELAICAVSGGVDSVTAALLSYKAIGKNLHCFYIDNGLMRKGETEEIKKNLIDNLGLPLTIIRVRKEFLSKLKGITDGKRKRKIIGRLFIRTFEKEIKKIGKVKYLIQGTIYPDVIESQGTPFASQIRVHHNVAGLPKKMKLQLVEPLRFYYKDEVRVIANKIGMPPHMITRQVFPGPGLAIRIMGNVTKKKLDIVRGADYIVVDEIKKAGLYEKLWMAFAVLTGVKTTAVKGDLGIKGETVAIRAIESPDCMTANWAKLPYDVLEKISTRITNEIREVSRVVYDISHKPPATMEWE